MSNYEKAKNGELADLSSRLVALIIDSVILGIVGGIGWAGGRGAGGVVGFLIGVAYQWYFLTQNNGQTLGKSVMGIRVVKINGEPLQATDAIVRYIGYYINTFVFGLGWIWALFDANKQGWHDKLAQTLVVRAR
jgi:uncharacterized RDD family membrane protein YckC